MSITPKNTHSQCNVHLNFDFRNQHGQPALCCSDCVTRRGKRAGKPQWIQWISKPDADVLLSDPDVDVRGDIYSYQNPPREISKGQRYQLAQMGIMEPEYDF